mmetsp:Transcript_21074/g.42204  ORF Transcript_21074/g.42204 Transcript_21074/m.42204 type:complete len:97 (+) Transcript_21074:246-536(+)
MKLSSLRSSSAIRYLRVSFQNPPLYPASRYLCPLPRPFIVFILLLHLLTIIVVAIFDFLFQLSVMISVMSITVLSDGIPLLSSLSFLAFSSVATQT